MTSRPVDDAIVRARRQGSVVGSPQPPERRLGANEQRAELLVAVAPAVEELSVLRDRSLSPPEAQSRGDGWIRKPEGMGSYP
jgi:hypothetical protein